MTLGAQPKKVAILGILLAVAAIALYMNVFAGGSESPAPRAVTRSESAPARVDTVPDRTPAVSDGRRVSRNNGGGEIKFRQGVARPEDRPDPATIDPTLRLDLLAKVQNVEPQAVMRNIFQYGAAAPPPTTAKLPALPAAPHPILTGSKAPPPVTAPPPGPPRPPTAPPMTFKYYGYVISKTDGSKQAFLLDGDEIIIATENEPVKRGRYRVVAIGLTSITIEDTQFKSNQTLRIVEDPAG